jgi:hypothetical protein
MEPEISYQKFITKYPALKARKRDIAKTTNYRLEVSIIFMEENRDRDVGHEINGGYDDGNPTQVDASWGRSRKLQRVRA